MSPKPMVIDTDGGVDDALAILLALRSPEVSVEAITTVAGNVSVEQATINVQKVLAVAGVDRLPPIAVGIGESLMGGRPTAAAGIHGDDGLGNLAGFVDDVGGPRYSEPEPLADPQNAIWVLLEAIRTHGENLTLVAIGPLTNLAVVARIDPIAFAKVGTIVCMAGAVDLPGNVAPNAEFNMWADPEAAAIALAANPNITMVGLDASVQAFLPRAEVDRWAIENPSLRTFFVRDCTRMYMDFYATYERVDGCYLHDPLAVAVGIDPTLVTRRRYGFEVELAGYTRGMLVADRRPRAPADPEKAVQVAWEVDTQRLLGQLVPQRLADLSA